MLPCLRGLVLLTGCLSLTVAACGEGSVIITESGDSSASAGGETTGGVTPPVSDPSTGAATPMGGTGDTGGSSSDGASSDGADDTGTTTGGEDDSSGSTGDGFCGPEDPGCGCDGVDVPDIEGMDENGDGIDGLRHCSVFVSELGGNDAASGLSPDDPVATIGRGIQIAQGFNPPRDVLIAEGVYAETVTVGAGSSLYGGYDASSWNRSVANNDTTVEAVEDRALIANDINEPTEIDGLTLVGANVGGSGDATYGVWVRDSPGQMLLIDHCTIVGGTGSDGNDGSDGSDGPNGVDGMNADLGLGGAGGVSACGAVGGQGGNGNICPSEDGTDGSAGGDGTMVGAGGGAGSSNCDGCFDGASPGAVGLPGAVGGSGGGGVASADIDGEFSASGFWIPPVGAAATDGLNGGGGGGGGAGGFDSDPFGCDIAPGEEPCSGGGGGGGSGGCGGDGGLPGESGGASFAVVIIDSEIEITNTDIMLGVGGNGGPGGDGGDGGTAGDFGTGAPPCPCATCGEEPEPGDNGGDGGAGGGGGGGPGGCGGMSIGIASVGMTMVTTGNVSFMGGTAGAPGMGGLGGVRGDGLAVSAPDGDSGCVGEVSDELTFP
ncbi:MAG: hypothetical protein AAF799_35985 [Myxococcota bacterium]